MKLSNLPLVVIISLFVLQIVYPNTLSGIIYDDNQKRLENALINLLSDIVYTTETDSNGEFLIQNIDNDICTIEISYIGFEDYRAQINLNKVDLKSVILKRSK